MSESGNIKIRRSIKFGLVVVMIFILGGALFQNCSRVGFGRDEAPAIVNQNVEQLPETVQDTLTSEGGSGEWYNGVLFSEVTSELCTGQDNGVRTLVSYVAATNHFWLMRSNCQDIDPILLPESAVVFNSVAQDSITYDGIILTTGAEQQPNLFTNPGTYSWAKPASGTTAVFECWGAGGGGSVGGSWGQGFGGGGGAYDSEIVALSSLSAVIEVVVGAGGVGGKAFGPGQPGGESRIAGIIAGGGQAGAFSEFASQNSKFERGKGGKGTGKNKDFGNQGLFPQDPADGGCSAQGCPSGGRSGVGGRGGFLGGTMGLPSNPAGDPGGDGEFPGGGGGGGGQRTDGSPRGVVGGFGGDGAHGQCRITILF